MTDNIKQTKPWVVYIVSCADNTLYTGITTDLERRIDEHNDASPKSKGAKYTRARQPVTLKHSESFENRSVASKREYEIKSLSRAEKLALCGS